MMTYEEATAHCEKLNDLQKRYWGNPSKEEKKSILGEWNLTCLAIKMEGFKLRKKPIRNDNGARVGTLWFVDNSADKPKRRRNSHSEYFEYTDNRPKDIKTLKGDCTTRCLAYCLKMKYESVLRKQRAYAKKYGCIFNDDDIWDRIMLEKGWKRVHLPKKMVRYEFALMTSGLKYPIATSSSGHVCATFKGKVIDIWESQNGRVDYVVVHPKEIEKVRDLLNKFG